MKKFVTIATVKESGKPEILAGPDIPFHVQRQAFKELKSKPDNDRFSGANLYELNEVGRAKFNRPPLRVIEAPKAPKADAKTEATPAKAKAPKAPKAQP